MADNYNKLWIQKTTNQQAIRRASQAIQTLGRALPCRVVKVNGSIVTVAFEVESKVFTLPQITIPKAESNWMRMPTQVGDKGVTMPADAYLGGVSNIGGGTAALTAQGNLNALVFMPVSDQQSPPDNVNAAQVMGPEGAIIRTADNACSLVLNADGVTVTLGSIKLVIDSSGFHFHGAVTGDSTAEFNGEGTFNGGHTVSAHHHPVVGVQPGSATINSNPPTG
jgi:hypothetical protein